MGRRCHKCSAPLDEVAVFCQRCGTRVKPSPSPPPLNVATGAKQRPWLGLLIIAVIIGVIVWWNHKPSEPSDPMTSFLREPVVDKNGVHEFTVWELPSLKTEMSFERRDGYEYNKLRATIHNDTEWRLENIRVRIQVRDDDKVSLDRVYKLDGEVAPHSDGDVTAMVTFDIPKDSKWTFHTEGATGRRPGSSRF